MDFQLIGPTYLEDHISFHTLCNPMVTEQYLGNILEISWQYLDNILAIACQYLSNILPISYLILFFIKLVVDLVEFVHSL